MVPIVFRPFCCSIDDVKGICVTRFVREIFFGHVNDFTVEEHQTPCHNIQTRLHSVIQNKHTHNSHNLRIDKENELWLFVLCTGLTFNGNELLSGPHLLTRRERWIKIYSIFRFIQYETCLYPLCV